MKIKNQILLSLSLVFYILFILFIVYFTTKTTSAFVELNQEITIDFYSFYYQDFIVTMLLLGGATTAIIVRLSFFTKWNLKIRSSIFFGGLTGVIIFISIFNFVFNMAAGPDVTMVSLCYGVRPWYKIQNWIFSFIPALIAGCIFALAGYHSAFYFGEKSQS